jgi:hypothetical protein
MPLAGEVGALHLGLGAGESGTAQEQAGQQRAFDPAMSLHRVLLGASVYDRGAEGDLQEGERLL